MSITTPELSKLADHLTEQLTGFLDLCEANESRLTGDPVASEDMLDVVDLVSERLDLLSVRLRSSCKDCREKKSPSPRQIRQACEQLQREREAALAAGRPIRNGAPVALRKLNLASRTLALAASPDPFEAED